MITNFQSTQAQLALLLWPFAIFYFFRRFSTAQAAIYSYMGGILFLPESASFKLPLFPTLDKYYLTHVVTFLAAITSPRKARGHLEPWMKWAFIGCFSSGLLVSATNQEPLFYGPTMVPSLGFIDGMFISILALIGTPLVTWIGMKCFSNEKDLETLVKSFATLGVLNGVLALVEVKMSPQIHKWIYGYDNNDFSMMIRHGGYRPQVLMATGLAFAIFLMGVLLMCCLMARFKMRVWKLSGTQAMWFMMVVVGLAKSTGVWVYAIVTVPIIMRCSAKTIIRVSVVLAVIVATYPWLRYTGYFPVKPLLAFASTFGAERADSLEFRFMNEDMLMKHAFDKFWFGWSFNYGRSMVFSSVSGKPISVTDGGWIIALGGGGVLGLFGYFAIPIGTVFVVARRMNKIVGMKTRTMMAGLVLYIAVSWVDILPNASFNLLPQFICGALCSISYNLSRKPRQPAVTRDKNTAQSVDERAPPTAAIPDIDSGQHA